MQNVAVHIQPYGRGGGGPVEGLEYDVRRERLIHHGGADGRIQENIPVKIPPAPDLVGICKRKADIAAICYDNVFEFSAAALRQFGNKSDIDIFRETADHMMAF
ncbi:hypothetical protein SDC9_126592 [bioreactor metagenome]|uniref:Uncharacterized protein n=1 Tax=bioreactor metagenome TaxID=1076179 RepID=A0A645CRN1_9ZZZZ